MAARLLWGRHGWPPLCLIFKMMAAPTGTHFELFQNGGRMTAAIPFSVQHGGAMIAAIVCWFRNGGLLIAAICNTVGNGVPCRHTIWLNAL